jgi:ATP-binding cassette, subfamily B, bacterial
VAEESRHGDFAILRRLLLEARPYWAHLAGIVSVEFLATPLALLAPLPLKIVVDSVVGTEALPRFLNRMVPPQWQEPTTLLIVAIAVLVVTAVLTQLQAVGATYLRVLSGGRMVLDFRNQLFAHGQRLSLARHDMKGVTDALYRIQYDTASIQNVAIFGVIPILSATVTVAAMLYVTAQINTRLALVAILVAPIMVVLTKAYRQPLRNRWREQKLLDHAAMSVINEVFSSLRVVKAFTQEQREGRRYVAKAREELASRLNVTLLQGSFDLSASLATAVGTGAVLFFGVGAIRAGAMTIGDLLIVMAYLGLLYAPLRTIGGSAAVLQNSFASAERAFALLDESPDVPESPGALPLSAARGDLELVDVSFGYDPAQPILRGISLKIPAGTRVGIAGKTGAGKTTLISLLMRFFDATAGQILLDGVDVKRYRLKDLRRQYSIVLQDTVLFSTTIRENIAYAKPDATEAELVAAARSARAHDFIVTLPEGYDTRVGERGMRLSGGERQRIALARAFLRDAPILILDEPTSSVDVKTEASIMEAMAELKQGRTTLMIAHRLTTLSDCDMLIRLEEGRIVTVTTDSHSIGNVVNLL